MIKTMNELHAYFIDLEQLTISEVSWNPDVGYWRNTDDQRLYIDLTDRASEFYVLANLEK
jgi:hypothetical protein